MGIHCVMMISLVRFWGGGRRVLLFLAVRSLFSPRFPLPQSCSQAVFGWGVCCCCFATRRVPIAPSRHPPLIYPPSLPVVCIVRAFGYERSRLPLVFAGLHDRYKMQNKMDHLGPTPAPPPTTHPTPATTLAFPRMSKSRPLFPPTPTSVSTPAPRRDKAFAAALHPTSPSPPPPQPPHRHRCHCAPTTSGFRRGHAFVSALCTPPPPHRHHCHRAPKGAPRVTM